MEKPDGLEAISVLGHELRRPLTVIRGAASLLLESGDRLPPDRAAHMLRLIDASGAAMSELIEDVLLACHMESGDLALVLEPVAAGRLIQASLDLVAARAGGVELGWAGAGEDVIVRADPGRAATVLRCLLDNAVRVSPPGGRVDLSVDPAPIAVRILVADRGPGLPTGSEERAFGRFERLGEGGRGAGLGLYLARGLARRMGGDVGVEGRPDGGSIFWFRLERDG